LSISVGTNNRK